MAELATIARPYAEALFRVAQSGNLSAWLDLVAEMAQAAAHPDVVALAHNPKVSAVQTAEAFLSVLKSPVNEEAKNFVNTLTEYDRLTLLPEIAAQFHALKNAQEGAADAQITSAFELTAEQVSDLATTLEKKFGRKLHPTVTVDNSLIGGVRIVVGDQVLDTSVRAKLQQMQVALTA
ncbi:F0F1 ATP synthase subunit delta [Undibacterium sp. RTI2.1]|uniref:F0F1 ATP synthase subunit delta n=1 Tax=unclassified Undibacterium TaxID=2630295 RepID=UPI002B23824C|nr:MULTISPECIES: F0F1 ATP synthase subunit delta [unclassified Undibacterium]MEB0030715.1 F0F1 ATP synthase subunit delta [Undibacterium sp. RTI2.1]MEB0117166.1 F0F1 ATP synthase subunit delta [Undibacterium sp. RTI2.2]